MPSTWLRRPHDLRPEAEHFPLRRVPGERVFPVRRVGASLLVVVQRWRHGRQVVLGLGKIGRRPARHPQLPALPHAHLEKRGVLRYGGWRLRRPQYLTRVRVLASVL